MYSETILLGVLVSLLYTEITGLSAGLIIPGYLVMSLHSPLRLAYTLAISTAAALICRLLSRWVILYGRRRFAMLLLLTYFLSRFTESLGIFPGGISVIGVLIPGIIAREFDRQGFADTLLSIAVTTGLAAALQMLLGNAIPGFGL